MKDLLYQAIKDIRRICKDSEGRTQYFEDGANAYYDSTRHFLESSSEVPAVAVQPGHVDDLAKIMSVLAKYKISFAVKGGGHATNPFFSSTMGVLIYMSRFNSVQYQSETQVVHVGAGCVWEEVYVELAKLGRNIVGGASSNGVGVAGYLLGGGYSLKTNQYGLAIDNVTAIEIIFPNGEVHGVHDENHQELFQALRGGGNNFGIVTRFTLKTHLQGKTWGANFLYDGQRHEGAVKAAILDFIAKEKRAEAAMVAAFRHSVDNNASKYNISVMCVLDGPRPALVDDPWQRFLTIGPVKGGNRGHIANWQRLMERQDYREIYAMATLNHAVLPDEVPPRRGTDDKNRWAALGTRGARGRFGCVMVRDYTDALITAVAREAKEAAKNMKEHKGKLVLMDVWPFLPSIFDKSPSVAWTRKKGQAFGPLVAYFLWEDRSEDHCWLSKMQVALDNVKSVAVSEGCFAQKAPVYSNNALEFTTIEDIYCDRLGHLSALRERYDPHDVMGRTGGFKIPLPRTVKSSGTSETLKKFNVQGFYNYRDPQQMSTDSGFMEFSLEYDTSTMRIRASGIDFPGRFRIDGVFDGREIRFIKAYANWEWQYMGSAAARGENVYEVTGAWGSDYVQYGSFAFTMIIVSSGGTRQLSSAARLAGEWTGFYVQWGTKYDTSLHLSADKNRLKGRGSDAPGQFTITGMFKGNVLTMTKSYPNWKFDYKGEIDASGSCIRGTWTNSILNDGGAFELIKGRSIAYDQAQAFILDKDQLIGPVGTVRMRETLAKQQFPEALANGFARLYNPD